MGTQHSPVALLKSLGGSHSQHCPTASLMLVGEQFTQWIPLDLLALVARGCLHAWPHGTVTIRKTVLGWVPHPGNCSDVRLKHTPSLPVKKAYCFLSWSFNLREWLQVCHTSRGNRAALREHRQGDTVFAPSLGLATAHQNLPERSLYACLKPKFYNCYPVNTSRSPSLEVSRVYGCGPTVYLYILKVAAA